MLIETLRNKFTSDNIKILCDAVKMACRTILKVEGSEMKEKFEVLREKLRETCLNAQVEFEVRASVNVINIIHTLHC